MKRHAHLSLLLAAVLVLSCSTIEPDRGDWTVEEEPESEDLFDWVPPPPPAPATPDEPEEQGPDEPVLNPDHDCPPVDLGTWDSQDFDFHVYRHLACQRDVDQAILFSPALLRIALAELAVDLGGPDGQAIAELLDFPDPESLHNAMEDYRQDLLSRMPTPSEYYYFDFHAHYTFDEDDPERLWQALALEFFSQVCDSPGDGCIWNAQNDRWGTSFLEPPDHLDAFPSSTSAILFRGQFEQRFATPRRRADRVESAFMTGTSEAILISEEILLSEWEFLGDDLSLLLIHTGDSFATQEYEPPAWASQSVTAIEEHLSSQVLQEAIESMKPTVFHSFRYVHRLPLFDLQETSEVGEFLRLPSVLPLTTRVRFDRQGINDPEQLTLKQDPPIPAGRMDGSGRVPAGFITFDEPFLFMIYDHPTESILLMGRVNPPPRDP